MNQVKKIFVLTVLLCSAWQLQSCAKSVASADDMRTIHKGMTTAEVGKMLDMEPKHSVDFSTDGQQYSVEFYLLMTSQFTTSSSSPGFGGGMVTTTSTTTTASPMLFLFSSNKLMYWGFMNDFSKSEDTEIEKLSLRIYDEYYKIYEK